MGLKKPSEIFAREMAPAYDDYLHDPANEYRANNLAAAINEHTEWTFKFCNQEGEEARLQGAKNLKEFRLQRFAECPDLQMMWDLADAKKHRLLDRPSDPPRLIKSSSGAYAPEGNDLRVRVYNRLFSEAADNAVRYWRDWKD